MSRGHGAMELYVLAALTHRNEMTAAALAAAHPSVGHELPSRSLRSSLNRALRNLQKSGRLVRLNRDGIEGFCLCAIPGDRLRTAYHEAGHAVIARLLGAAVECATIKPTPGAAGHVLMKKKYESEIVSGTISLAGKYAETLLLDGDPRHPWEIEKGSVRRGASKDHENVRWRVIRHVGIPHGDGKYLVNRRDARAFRRRLEKEAKHLVIEYRETICRVAEALVDRETLTGAEIDVLLWG